MTVTATGGGGANGGIVLRVFVLRQARLAGQQNGATAGASSATSISFDQSITTTQTGSRVYGAASNFTTNTAFGADANTTLLDDIGITASGDEVGTFKATSTTGTPGATTIGFSTPANDAGSVASAEILAAGTLTEDASAPASVNSQSATNIATASFTPPPGSLIVALVAAVGVTTAVTMSMSGGSLTWTNLAQQNAVNANYAGVFIAQTPPLPPVQMRPNRALLMGIRGTRRLVLQVPVATIPLNVSSLTSSGLGTNTTSSSTTASISPTAGSLLVLWVVYSLSGGTTISSVTNTLTGVTFTQQKTLTVSSSTKIDCWTAVCGGSPGSGTITMNFAAANATRAWDVDQVTGENQAVPLIVSNTLTNTGGSGTNPALAMNAPANTRDLYLFGIGVSGLITTVSPNESPAWIQLARQGFSSPSVTLETQVSPNVANTTAGATFSSPAVWGAIGIEVNMAPVVIATYLRRPIAAPRRATPEMTALAVAAPAVVKIPPAGLPRKAIWFDRAYKRTQQARLIIPAVPVPLPPRMVSVRRLPADIRHDKITPPFMFLRVSGPVLPPVASRPRIPQGWVRIRSWNQPPLRLQVSGPVPALTASRPRILSGWVRSRGRAQLPLASQVPLARLRARVQAWVRKTGRAQLPPPPPVVPPAVLPPRAAPARARWSGIRTRPAPQLAPVVAAPVITVLPPSATGSRARQAWSRMRTRIQAVLPVPAVPAVPPIRTRQLAGIRLRARAQQVTSSPSPLQAPRPRQQAYLRRPSQPALPRITVPVPQPPPAQGQRARPAPPARRQLQLPVQAARVIAGLRSVIRLPAWLRRQPTRQQPPALAGQVQQGTAVLQAPSVLSAQATAGPDLGNLWLAYLAAEDHANQLTFRWEQIVQAGGSSWASAAYSVAYQAQIAAGNAYAAYVNAYHQVNKSPPGDPPLPTA